MTQNYLDNDFKDKLYIRIYSNEKIIIDNIRYLLYKKYNKYIISINNTLITTKISSNKKNLLNINNFINY